MEGPTNRGKQSHLRFRVGLHSIRMLKLPDDAATQMADASNAKKTIHADKAFVIRAIVAVHL